MAKGWQTIRVRAAWSQLCTLSWKLEESLADVIPIEREARCACGSLSLRVRGEPLLVGICHCQQCQRRTGSAFGSGAFFNRAQVVDQNGSSSAYTRTGDSGRSVRFHFCPTCGSTVYWDRDHRPDLVAVALGAFADPSFPPPSRAAWTDYVHAWVKMPEQMVSHLKNP